MLFCDITYIDGEQKLIDHAWIGTEGSRISYIGSAEPPQPERFGRRISGRDRLMISGFYNAHSHSGMGLLRGYAENMSLDDWLHKRIFPFEDHLTADDVYRGTMLCCAEMLRFGIVGTTDMYMFTIGMGNGFRDGGVKANFSIGATNFDGSAYPDMRQCRETIRAAELYHNSCDGRLKVDYSMHAEYTSHEKMVRTLADTARDSGLRMHVHVSETAAEVAACRERHHGLSPVQYLAECGLFDTPTTAAHCVHIDADDIAILRDKEVSVASCPKSNLKLASGIAPIKQLIDAGVNVALATDSVSSNNNLNFIEELRFFSLLQKGVSGDPTAITPQQALYCATRAGALSQGREDCGCISVGQRADLVLLDTSAAHWHPSHDLLNNLIYSACGEDVIMTVVDGNIRYENGDWPHLDIEKIYAEASASCRRIISEL